MNQKKEKLKICDYFDKIFILNLSCAIERREFILRELEELGLSDEIDKKIVFHYAPRIRPEIEHSIALNRFTQRFMLYRPSEYSCTREWCSIVEESLYTGKQRILVIEDDCSFLKDVSYINRSLENIPSDADFLRFHVFSYSQTSKDYNKEKVNDYWMKDNIKCWNMTCTAFLTDESKKYYLDSLYSYYTVADFPLYNLPNLKKKNSINLNSYISSIPLCIQNKRFESFIRNINNDKINYNLENIYEKNIDLSSYFF